MTTTEVAAMPETQQRERRIFWLSVAIVILTKLYILWSSTADMLGDHNRPLAFADEMLRSSRWLFDAGIDQTALPPALWKIPGHSLMMAGAKLAFGPYWLWTLAISQSIMSFIAGLFVRRLALALGLGPILAAAALVMYAWSVPASTDTLLMPDGWYGSIVTIVIAVFGMKFLSGSTLSLRNVLGAGLAVMACYWIRELFSILVVPLAVMLIAPFWLNGMRVRRAAFLLVVFCAPTLLSDVGMRLWNRYRTGEYIVAVVATTVYLVGALKVAEKVPAVFDGDTLLDHTARRGLKDYDYGDSQLLPETLFKEYGIKAPEMLGIAKAKYWETVARFPGTFARTMLERLRYRQQASMLGDVLMRLDDLDWWRYVGPQKPYISGWRADMQKFLDTRDFRVLTPGAIANTIPRIVLRTITLILFTLFTFALPWILVRDLRRGVDARPAALLGSLYLTYWGVVFLYMLVNVEIRYLSLICSIPIFSSLWVCLRIVQQNSKWFPQWLCDPHHRH